MSSERWQLPAAMAAPIPPERDVKALLLKHAEAIAKLRNSVADVLKDADTELYDDVFLLRFCMSAADAAHAEEALRKTLAWRKEKAALLAGVRRVQMDRGRKYMGHILWPSHPLVHMAMALQARPGAVPPPNYETLCKFVAAGMHGRTKEGDYLFIIRAGGSGCGLMACAWLPHTPSVRSAEPHAADKSCALQAWRTARPCWRHWAMTLWWNSW